MSQPLIVPLPPGLDLEAGCTIRVTAVDPTTGAGVAGVTVKNMMIEADQLKGTKEDLIPPVLLLRR